MSSGSETREVRRLACVVSEANGEDPAGTGTAFVGYLLVEIAPPWKYDVGGSRHFPEGLWEAVKGVWEAGVIGKFTALMPDSEYSREGHARAILLRRPPGPFFAFYEKEEYVIPEGELVPLVEALAEPEDLSRFARYGEATSGDVRDILVCTHRSHDVCCGRFGYPLYEELYARGTLQGLGATQGLADEPHGRTPLRAQPHRPTRGPLLGPLGIGEFGEPGGEERFRLEPTAVLPGLGRAGREV